MTFRVLDVVLISAKNLKQVNFKAKVFAFASVRGYNNNLYISLKKTPIDKDVGSFPVKCLIDVDAAEKNCFTLVIKLKADGFFGDKDIGEAHVPVKELLDKYDARKDGARKDEMLESYSVLSTRSRKAKGVLNFSFKFGDAMAAPPAPLTPGEHPPEETSIGKKLAKKLGAFLWGSVKIAAAVEVLYDNFLGS